MLVEIDDKLYKEFTTWAKYNNFSDNEITVYINKCFRDRFTLDKYGDLNEKIKKETPIVKTTTSKKKIKKDEDVIVEIKNVNDEINQNMNIITNQNITPSTSKKKKIIEVI
jgi:hypothetical protein